MAASICIDDNDSFTLLAGPTPIGTRRRLAGEALAGLQALNRRYALLERRPDPAAILAIGRDLYRWLDGDQQQLQRLIAQADRPLLFNVHCLTRDPSAAAWALLQAPWELLADARGPLAADALLQFSPLRRLGPVGQPPPLDGYRLGLAFMAAAPDGVDALDYEAEEAAILDAVGTTNLDLLVEESGGAAALGRRLGEVAAAPADVLGLSSTQARRACRAAPDERPEICLTPTIRDAKERFQVCLRYQHLQGRAAGRPSPYQEVVLRARG